MRHQTAADAKATALRSRQAGGKPKEAEKLKREETQRLLQAEAAEKAANLARISQTFGNKDPIPPPEPPASATPDLNHADGDPTILAEQTEPIPLNLPTTPLTPKSNDQQAGVTGTEAATIDQEILPDATDQGVA